MTEIQRPAIIYAAKSTADERGSIRGQLADGRALAESEGLAVVGEFADEAASAFSSDRGPDLAKARAEAERLADEHGECAFIVQHSDRVARGDGIRAAHLVEYALWAIKRNVKLRSVQDPQTFSDLLYTVVTGQRNHEDSRRKSAAVKAGARRTAERGGYTCGPEPYGYGFQRDQTGRPVRGLPLVPVPHEAVIVRRVFEDAAAGKPQLVIARSLNADDVATKRGGRWHQSQIAALLGNPLFKGYVRHGEETYEGQHEAIVPPELWDRVAELRAASARTKGKGRGRRPKGGHLFVKGHLRCGRCGSAMIPVTKPTKTDGLYTVYQCYGRVRHGVEFCPQTPVKRERVDSAVYGFFERVGLDVEATRRQLADGRDRKLAEVGALRHQAEHEARRAEERLARVRRDYMDGTLAAADWAAFRDELTAEQVAARAEADRLAESEAEVEREGALLDAEQETLVRLGEIRRAIAGEVADADGVDAVRAALSRLFSTFVLHPQQNPRYEGSGRAELVDVDQDMMIELVVREQALEGYDERLLPILRREPLSQAENKSHDGFTRWSSAPRVRLRTRSASPARPLSTITGRSGSTRVARPSEPRTRSSSDNPLPSSSVRSSTSRAGCRTSIARSPSATPPAPAARKPSATRLSTRKERVNSSSSTTRIARCSFTPA